MANIESILDAAVKEIAGLQNQVDVLQEQKAFLIGELKVASRAFEHAGLQGYQWVADQAVLMAEGGKHEKSN